MKRLTTTTLALALALGAMTAGVVTPQPAIAAKAPKLKLSDGVRKAIAEAQAAVKANDLATAQVKITEAKAAAQTDDDRYVIFSQQYDVARLNKDQKGQAEAIDGMLQSGKVAAENQGQFYTALGQLSYATQNYAKAEQALTQASKLDPANKDVFALLAEVKYKNRKPAEALALIQQAADAGTASGQPIPKDWYARGVAIGMEAKLGDPVAKLSKSWLKDYPERTNWRDSLIIYRDLHPMDAEMNLDLMRLQRAVGALKGERDYSELVEATYLKFPGEAKSVVDEGSSAGAINTAQSKSIKEMATIASGKIAADKSSLKKTAANGRSALGMADAYASYGDYASAIEMYDKAASLGGVDMNTVKLRKGAALAKSGQKDAAKQVFGTVAGPRADLAQYWTIFIDHPPVA
ncbi:MAG: tetratricopeptide repeat protein [Sphingomonadaceae bacterium]